MRLLLRPRCWCFLPPLPPLYESPFSPMVTRGIYGSLLSRISQQMVKLWVSELKKKKKRMMEEDRAQRDGLATYTRPIYILFKNRSKVKVANGKFYFLLTVFRLGLQLVLFISLAFSPLVFAVKINRFQSWRCKLSALSVPCGSHKYIFLLQFWTSR